MQKLIAILRGINVGGNRKMKMPDLKVMLSQLDLEELTTYIQSGNVIFQAPGEPNPVKLEAKIENAIEEKFGYDVPVIIRPAAALAAAADRNPFVKEGRATESLHLVFLKSAPDAGLVHSIEAIDFAPDRFIISGRDIYLYCNGPYHQTKLTNNFFERKLRVGATTRNWKTVRKLAELSRE